MHIDHHLEHDSDEEWEVVSYPVTAMGCNSDDQVTQMRFSQRNLLQWWVE